LQIPLGAFFSGTKERQGGKQRFVQSVKGEGKKAAKLCVINPEILE